MGVSKIIEYHIFCDKCRRDGGADPDPPFGYGQIISLFCKRDARKIAKSKGGKTINGLDLCPDCISKQP